MKRRLSLSRILGVTVVCVLAFYVFAVLFAGILRAQDKFTPELVSSLRWATEAVISPNGRSVCFVVAIPRQPLKGEKNGPPWQELYITDGTGVSRALVTGHVNVSDLSWTPDGTRISFLAKRETEEKNSLDVIPMDGGEAHRILTHNTNIRGYSWSPDGKRAAYLAPESAFKAKKALQERGFNQEVYGEELSRVRIWIAEPGRKGSRAHALDIPGSASELHWSPHGSLLAVAVAPTASLDDEYMKRKVYVLDADSGNSVARFDNPGKLGQIAWSPDGKYLAFISAGDPHDPLEGRLMVAPATGGEMHDLLPEYEAHISGIAWRDPNTVMFLADEGVWTAFGEVGRDGSGRKTLLPTGGPILTGFSLARDGQMAAFIGDDPRHPAEVFLMKMGEASPHLVSDSNPWLARMPFATQEAVTFHARDGLRLEGVLIHPLNQAAAQRYPLILIVHGGPEGHYSNGWNTDWANLGQVAADNGFAVFYPNYRSSAGRGVTFSKMDHRDPGGKEFDDLVDAVDHLASSGLVDQDHVGITGISYGGYASAWGATYYSDRFAASAVIAGIGDLISHSGTSGNPDELYLVHYAVRPWEDWNLFWKRSPIFYAEKRHTPTLILQGEGDPVVTAAQALELYNYLKWMSPAPVRLVLYPGEGHVFSAAASRLDASSRLLQWMQHYLRGQGGTPPPPELHYGDTKP